MAEHFLKEIEITNFKSIRHQKIEGCKRINLFLGYPNVGKSNILEAIGSTGMFELSEKAALNVRLKDWIRLREMTDIFFEGEDSTHAIVRISGTEFTFYIQKGEHIDLLEFKQEARDKAFLFDRNFKLERYIKPAFEPLSYASGLLFKANVRPYLFRKRISYSKENVSYLGYPNGENIIDILSGNPKFRKQVSELFKQYNIRLIIDKNNNELKLTRDTEDSLAYFIDYSLVADTLQRLIFYKAAVASNKNAVLVFEEPEAHMFPPYIKTLMWDIIESKTNQFFIATHSPFVLDTLLEEGGEEVIIYLVDFKNGETVVKPLSPEGIEEVKRYGIDLFFNIEDYLKNEEQSARH